jgi:hypothetical protein
VNNHKTAKALALVKSFHTIPKGEEKVLLMVFFSKSMEKVSDHRQNGWLDADWPARNGK